MARIAFLQNLWWEWLGLMYISAMLKKEGHETDMFIGNKEEITQELKLYNPDIISASIMNIQFDWLKETVGELRKNGFKQPIIVGGPEATYAPQDVMNIDGVDVVCVGEGEEPIKDYVEAVINNKSCDNIENLWVKKSNKVDENGNFIDVIKNPTRRLADNLDPLPWADRELYRKYKWFQKDKSYELFLASRGCPFDCSFCFNHQFRELYKGKARLLRMRTPQDMVNEIKYVNEKYGIKNVMFIDSTFNLHKRWAIEFCNLFAEQTNLPMTCNVRADLMDEEVAQALVKARCDPARFAIETGSDYLRNSILEKRIKDEQIYNTVSLFKKYKIPFVTFNMMGLPTETLDMAWQTIYMNRKLNPNVIAVDIFMPFPNLNITKYAEKEGLIDQKSFKDMTQGRNKMFRSVLKQKEIKEVSNLHKFAILLIRFPKLEKLVKKLIHFPENSIFDGIWGLAQAIEYMGWSHVSKKRAILEIVKNFRELT